MQLSREVNLALNWVLNELVPPWIRDRRWFGWLITKLLYGKNAHYYMTFHSKVFSMSEAEFAAVYEATHHTAIKRDTNLNHACLDLVLKHAEGPKVLEAGCGTGFLAKKLAERFEVTAADIVVPPELAAANPKIAFKVCNLESLPFPDNSFDTVVSTHVLEHVRDIAGALRELRRVARKRLIIVVPKERPHLYTPNLHLHFFPYPFSFYAVFGYSKGSLLENAKGDWFYVEDKAR